MSAVASSSDCSVEYCPKYCSLCDMYFYSTEMLKAHLQSSSRHPKCTACEMSFLNNNSLRNHYVLSVRHHFCRICEKHFKTAAGLRIHLEYSHLDSDSEDGPSTRSEGWEDRLGFEEEAALGNGEIPIPREDVAEEALPAPAVHAAKLRKSAKATGVLKPTCPICLSGRKTMCATRCGHVFCSPCITRVLSETWSCPACRQPALASQLRTLNLHVYGNAH
ncbi:hypothetical protein DFH07DRAFT_971286 [Mycena maculata]|uniref:RING-type domain-containing protein n=1 Tax=Mycena maculata TaxID=230809 RepID=A0AAD7MMC3_9AGAR|nr:hypothetical protein DFH07DRAFT_971286 [Mycena maculata]